MSIDLQLDSQILIQGVDNALTLAAISRIQAYGTKIVGMTIAGKGGQQLGDLPIFDLVEQAQTALGSIETSLIFVPAYEVLDAALKQLPQGFPSS